MYSVLIVDDEFLVRLALKNSIDWHKYNMTVIADVQNGQAAWEICQKEMPDLIVTDIKMPVMDGMELIRKVRQASNKTNFVILSCLEEIELLRQAIDLNVSGYILKLTMTNEEIEKVLLKVRNELDKSSVNVDAKIEKMDMHAAVEKVFKQFVFYNQHSEEEFEKRVAEFKLPIFRDKLQMGLMEIDHFPQMQLAFGDTRGLKLSDSILNILNEVLSHYRRVALIRDSDKRYILLFSFHDIVSEQNRHKELHAIVAHVRKVLKNYLNSGVSFGISSVQNGYSSLGKLYAECDKALEFKFYSGLEKTLTLNDPIVKRPGRSAEQLLKGIGEGADRFNETVRAGIASRIGMLLASEGLSEESVKQMIAEWIYWLSVSLHFDGEASANSIISVCLERVQVAETLEEAVVAYGSYMDETVSLLNEKRKLGGEVAEAIQFIQANYATEMSLQQVSAHVGLSPNYLSGLLKKETGLSFVEYISHLRIESAKKLLLNTTMKSYEIAEQVGFADDSYFSRTFKKLTGVRPHEFRKHRISHD